MAAPVLSVVMPSLNQRPFIADAVRSVMAQGVDALELVVMDGGSVDGTLTELAALSAECPGRLRWFSRPDAGPADAIHQAVLAARAPLIGWLNSDDLYGEGAAKRALDHLQAHPGHVMVYGQGDHVDGEGRFIARYPTLPPTTPLANFADGCFICQPTVFFRREAYLALGGLDNHLRTAFDFDLWLRLFKAHPQGIGFIDAVQAKSRLHEGSITLRQREQVALEGLEVIRRHLGPAPGHWLLTHLEELCAQHPFHTRTKDLRAEFTRLVERALPFVGPTTADELMVRMASDRRLRLATPQLFVGVHADGWAGDVLDVRLWQPDPPLSGLRLHCRNGMPGGSLLRLHAHGPDATVRRIEVDGPGPFELELELPPPHHAQSRVVWRLVADDSFVPDELDGNGDRRRLAYQVEQVEALPA
jgi:hypothetical protein